MITHPFFIFPENFTHSPRSRIETSADTKHYSAIYALQVHNTKNLKQMFPEKELHSYSPNSYIHVSVSDLYIPPIGLLILLQEKRSTERGNI